MKKENAALFSYSDKQKTMEWEDEIVAIFNCYKANSFSKYVLLKELSIITNSNSIIPISLQPDGVNL